MGTKRTRQQRYGEGSIFATTDHGKPIWRGVITDPRTGRPRKVQGKTRIEAQRRLAKLRATHAREG